MRRRRLSRLDVLSSGRYAFDAFENRFVFGIATDNGPFQIHAQGVQPVKTQVGANPSRLPSELAGQHPHNLVFYLVAYGIPIPDSSGVPPNSIAASGSGVVFCCVDSGALAAADAKSGKPLWRFEANQIWKTSPMTYMTGGKQYVAAAAGPNIVAFGL